MRNLVLVGSLCLAGPLLAAEGWPQFRGPDGQGHSAARGVPTAWSETENVAWKAPVPGLGWSSPVVEDDRIWMTAATDEGRSLRAVCLAANDGALLHDIEVFRVATPLELNKKNSHASPSPIVENGRVYVHFGTQGTACLDAHAGKILWTNDELHVDHKEGPGSSPVMCGELLILTMDGVDAQFVAAVDKRTGKVAWKTARTGANNPSTDFRKAYATPLVIETGGQRQIISVGADRLYAYDPSGGSELWHVDFAGFSNTPRPTYDGKTLYVCTGYMKPQLLAVRPGGAGDLTATNVVWRAKNQVSLSPSPLLVGEWLFMVSDQGVAICLESTTGVEMGKARLGGNYSASPTLVDGKIYFFTEEGEGIVTRAEPKLEIVARNRLDGRILATPAFVGRAMFVRSDTHLYRIESGAN